MSSPPSPSTSNSTITDIYSHDLDCKYNHPIPDSDTLDNIINSAIESFSPSYSSITREFIEKTIHQSLHSLLIPPHKCKSPYAFHQHSNARTLFKSDYTNIIHKEILAPKPKLSVSPTTSTNCASSSRSNSVRNITTYPYPSSPSTSSKTLDQEINILATLWGESSQDIKQVYEVLEKCSERVHEYMFKANRVEKVRIEKERDKDFDNYRAKNIETNSSQSSNILDQEQNITTTDILDQEQQNITTTDYNNTDENYESKNVQKELK